MIINNNINKGFLIIVLISYILSCKNKDEFETIQGNNKDYNFSLSIEYYKDSIDICCFQEYKGKSSKRIFSLNKKDGEYYSPWQEILTPNGQTKNVVFMSIKKDTAYKIESAPPNNYEISFSKYNTKTFKSEYNVSGISKYRRTIYHDSNYRIMRYELMLGDSLLVFKRK